MVNPLDLNVKMSETLQEVLKSNDVDLIKRARATYKGKLTRTSKSLIEELKRDDNGVFLLDEIDKTEAASILSTMQKVKDTVEELHIRFTIKRVCKDGSEEDKFEKEDDVYSKTLEKTYRDAVKVYNSFNEQLKAKEKSIKDEELLLSKQALYPDKLRHFKAKILEYESAHQEANTVIESKDEFVQRTATLQKEMLCKEYDSLLNMGLELSSLAEKLTGASACDRELFVCSKEKLTHRKTLTSLERLIKKHEFEDRDKLAKLAPAPLVSGELSTSGVVGPGRSSNVLKIKVSAPKFSGKSREFAVFKRDFNAIVAVDNRNNVEIGALLKESIPDSYKYLLDKYDLSEHVKMMDTLTQKFGRPRVIIDECTAEIKKMKKLTTDNEFINFVDHLDKLKRDLSQLNLLSDVANTTVISEIEKKLPDLVQRDWIKLVSSKDMAEKSSSEIFEHLFEFLEDTKRQAEYFGTEVRQQSNDQFQAATNIGFVNCGVTDEISPNNSSRKVKAHNRVQEPLTCLACCDGLTDLDATTHPTNDCDVWRSLTFDQRKEKVNCLYHPARGLHCNHTTAECSVGKARCQFCKENNSDGHHTWFCHQAKAKTKTSLTKTSSSTADMLNPVMVKTLFVTAVSPDNNKTGKLGCIIDDCSTDHYVTFKAAKMYGFHGKDVELCVEGLGGKKETYLTRLYTVPVIDKEGYICEYQCFGLETIATADVPTTESYTKICDKFGLKPTEVIKPKEIDLLISARSIGDHPVPIESYGHLILYNGKFGKVISGTNSDLKFRTNKSIERNSCTHKTYTKLATATSVRKNLSKKVKIGFEDNLQCSCCHATAPSKSMLLQQKSSYKYGYLDKSSS